MTIFLQKTELGSSELNFASTWSFSINSGDVAAIPRFDSDSSNDVTPIENYLNNPHNNKQS